MVVGLVRLTTWVDSASSTITDTGLAATSLVARGESGGVAVVRREGGERRRLERDEMLGLIAKPTGRDLDGVRVDIRVSKGLINAIQPF